MTQPVIGFIGLGNMGGLMAANLARAGRRLVVRDLDPALQAAFVEQHGATPGDDPAAFANVDALLTMLPDGAIVRSALMESGIADALHPDTLVIDTSSSSPTDTLALAPELATRRIALVDAPVSGGMVRAAEASLSIMLGADGDALAERAAAVLEPVSAKIFRTGGLGSGHATKALNNYVLGAGFVAAAEALVIGERFGLDADVLLSVLNASSGRNVSTETTIVEEVLTGRYRANFTLGLFSKDVGIAHALAQTLKVDAPLATATHGALAAAGEELGWHIDYTRAVQLWERQAGLSPRESTR